MRMGNDSEYSFDDDEAALSKELTLQVRKVIGPFAAPKKIFIVSDLPKTRSGKVSSRRFFSFYLFVLAYQFLCVLV